MAPCPWDSLPPELLGRCLRVGTPSDQSARFSTCTSFTKAMLLPDPDRKDPQLTVHVDDFRPALVNVLRWAAEEGRFRLKLMRRGETQQHASLQPLLDLLHQEGVLLTGVRTVWCKGLRLITGELLALAPNLQELRWDNCQVAEGMLPLSGCNQLRELLLDPEGRFVAAHTAAPAAWHNQIASLPSLASLTLNARSQPTSFFPLLAEQLTQLRLISRSGPDLDVWLAALGHAAHLTNLRSLELGNCPAQELAVLTTTLLQLQQLTLTTAWNEDGDAIISTLLRFPHLTRLTWFHPHLFNLQQSYMDHTCSWKELQLSSTTPQVLARLPLNSLSTLRLGGLRILFNMKADDISAAVHNINRSRAAPAASSSHAPAAANISCSQAGQATSSSALVSADSSLTQAVHSASVNHSFTICLFGEDEIIEVQQAASSYTELLPLIAPLVPQDLTSVTVDCYHDEWQVDAAVVVALQQALAHTTVTRMAMRECRIHATFWPQLARSFPHLKHLTLDCSDEQCDAWDVMGYYHAASLAHHPPGVPHAADVKVGLMWDVMGYFSVALLACQASGMPKVADVQIELDPDNEDGQRADSFKQLNQHLRLMGLSATVTIPG